MAEQNQLSNLLLWVFFIIRISLKEYCRLSKTISSYFFPVLSTLPVISSYMKRNYLWSLSLSPAYIGQGIIMVLPTTLSMLLGAILGWGILGPLAKARGWAPGDI